VNDLVARDINGNPVGGQLRGVGWMNGNGVIVDKEARLDTLAHEVGHNLGLVHVTDPKNIMANGDTRAPITTTINDVNPNGQQLDQLTAAQGDDVRGPLFANGTARVAVQDIFSTGTLNGNTGEGRADYFYEIDFQSTSTPRRLTKLQLFYEAGEDVDFSAPGEGTKTVTPAATILEVTFPTPLGPGDDSEVSVWRGHTTFIPIPPPDDPFAGFDVVYPDHPLFIRYVFDNGVASQALFDKNGKMFSDDPANTLLFVGTPDDNGRPLALQGNEIDIELVPEPATILVFGSALLLPFWRRRRA
jgi:hypothetical protein